MPTTDSCTIDVGAFDIAATLRCGRALRESARTAPSLEDAAQRIVRLLYDSCVDPDTGQRSCALVRFYKTHAYEDLDPSLRVFALRQLGGERPAPSMKSLVLLGTAGDAPAWNDRRRSRDHRVIPLASEDMILRAPMIARLFEQFGVGPAEVLAPADDVLPERAGRTYNVFHVEAASGSPYIPEQRSFVERNGIASVVGFGGTLRSGNLFATILFSRARIPPESANRFRALAVDVKSGLFFLDESRTFAAY